MINSNKMWLLTASPWMKHSFWLSPLAIGGIFLTALLLLGSQTSKAQIHYNGTIGNGFNSVIVTNTVHQEAELPAIQISGTTVFCTTGTVNLTDATTGGTWSSDNTTVATVVATGTGNAATVSAFAPGVANIYYRVGTSAALVTITFTYPITTATTTTVCAGNTLTLSDQTTTGLWSSSNTTVATVSPTGAVYALSGVSVTTPITIFYGRWNYAAGASECTVTKTITVNPNGLITSSGTTITGPSIPLAVCGSGSNTITLSDAISGGTWSSSTSSVATITPGPGAGGGIATGVSAGATIITYSQGGCYTTAPLSVNSTSTIAPISGSATVCQGNVTPLSDATSLGFWSSTSTTVIVNTVGGVTGIANGPAVISYTKGGCAQTFAITVVTNAVTLTSSANVCHGGTTVLTGSPAGGNWSSSNASVATVAAGTVYATAGSLTTYATITYSFTGSCYQTSAITVNTVTIPAISGPGAVCVGSNVRLTDATPGGVWSSGTTSFATIDAYGYVYGATPGADVITYNLLGCTQTKAVTVNALPVAITGTTTVCSSATTQLSNAEAGTWSSSNTLVATVVGASGLVTGVGGGTTIITFTSTATGCSVTTSVTSTFVAPITGGNTACIGILSYLELADITSGGTWTSSNTLNATVGAGTGTVTGLNVGTVTISYTKLGCSVTKTVTVNSLPPAITGNLFACAGSSTTLSDASGGGVWSSSLSTVATVGSASGIVTGSAAGSTIISYTLAGCTKTANVSIAAMPAAITGPAFFQVCAGASSIPGSSITLSDVTTGGAWTASNNNLTLNTSGFPLGGPDKVLVTGQSLPTGVTSAPTIISYTLSGCSITTTVTVTANTVAAIGGTPYVCTGQTNTSLVDGIPGGTWSISNTALATIDPSSGIVGGGSAGVAVITYTGPGISGCFKTMIFDVNATPRSIHGANAVCVNNITTLSDQDAGGGWTSSDPTVANITPSTGVVNGVDAGSATITYSMNGCSVYQPITVSSYTVSITGGTTVNPAAASLCTIFSTTLTATPASSGAWSSSNTTLATVVSATGVVYGVSDGIPNITYTNSTNGCYAFKAVTVNSVIPLAISGTNTVCVNNVTILSDPTPGGAWSSSNTTATVSLVGSVGGLVTGVAAGTPNISYTYLGCPVIYAITVFPNNITTPITGTTTLCANGTTTLTDAPGGGTWSSSNSSLATVDLNSGLVSGTAAGSPIITYTSSACYRTATLTINAIPAAITGGTNACVGLSTLQLFDITPDGTWSSSNTAKAIVDINGYVAGVATGSANISYTLSTGCGVNKAITVNSVPSAINAGTGKLCNSPGNTLALSDATTGGTWSSSDNSLATVGSTGTGNTATFYPVTPISAGLGSPTIYYTDATTGCYVTKSISIGDNATTDPTGLNQVCVNSSIYLSDAIAGGAWATGNTTIVTISTYAAPLELVIGASVGVASISYTSPGCSDHIFTVTVLAATAPISGTFSVCTGLTQQLSDATPSGTWSSDNTNVATVNATGLVTGGVAGLCNIIYSSGGCTVTQGFDVSSCSGKITGVIEHNAENQKYTLYPNPSNGNITIQQSIVEHGEIEVSVVNYVGAIVYTGTIEFTGGKGQLNIPGVSAGVYLVMIRNNKGELQNFKMVIEK